ncbi:MAG: hypothetical protein PHE36_06260 [Novosphingobium sp.]|nr:hypothetical protein [Novosphingobium sp.]
MTHTASIASPSAASQQQAVDPSHHGSGRWTPERQARFLRHLGATHSVSAAARAVGMSRQSAYQLRNRLKGEPFDAAWTAAFRTQCDRLAEAALERARNGVEVPYYYKGELVGTHRVFNERLTLALLSMRDELMPPHRPRHAEEEMYPPDDFAALVERVETGDELWAEEDDSAHEDEAGDAEQADGEAWNPQAWRQAR